MAIAVELEMCQGVAGAMGGEGECCLSFLYLSSSFFYPSSRRRCRGRGHIFSFIVLFIRVKSGRPLPSTPYSFRSSSIFTHRKRDILGFGSEHDPYR